VWIVQEFVVIVKWGIMSGISSGIKGSMGIWL
jgi:hypothetical protein